MRQLNLKYILVGRENVFSFQNNTIKIRVLFKTEFYSRKF